MTIERAKNTNVITLSKDPISITSVQGKSASSNFFTSILNYKLDGRTITLRKSYSEFKVDYVDEQPAQYDPQIAKQLFNFELKNIEKTNPIDALKTTSNSAQSKLISVQGSTFANVGQVLGGFLSLTQNTKQNQTVTDETIASIVTEDVPGIVVKKTSDEKGNISILTGTVAEDGLLNAMIVTANPAGIKAALTEVIGVTEASTKTALQATSSDPDKVVEASNEDIAKTVTTDAKKVIKKANRTIGNPLHSDNPFGSLGLDFGNILAGVLGKIKATGTAQNFGDVVPGISTGVQIPAGETPPPNIVESDASTTIAKSVKPSGLASNNIKSSRPAYNVASNSSKFNGAATPVSTGEYVFENVNTSEELEAELRNTTRDITTAVVHWSETHSDSPFTARDMHTVHLANQTEELGNDLDALKKLVALGPQAGINWHYVLLRDGTIQRGRPINLDSGPWVGYTNNTVHIGFIAGYSVPFGTPNSELYLGSESITPQQWKSFDKFLDAFYKTYPGGEALGHKEINPSSADPGFEVSLYVSGKYNKTTTYDNPSEYAEAFTPEEQITRKPQKIKKPSASTIESSPLASDRAVADVDSTLTQEEIDASISRWRKLKLSTLSLQRQVNAERKRLNEDGYGDATNTLDALDSKLQIRKSEQKQIRKDLINNGYTYSEKDKTWSKS